MKYLKYTRMRKRMQNDDDKTQNCAEYYRQMGAVSLIEKLPVNRKKQDFRFQRTKYKYRHI